jgi:iron complex outermembrane receptor protein
VKYARKGLDVAADVYAMEFRDEIALAGELSPIGLPLRRNVDRSYRRGIEVDLLAQLHPKLHLRWNANASRNRIRDWTQFYDVYDPAGTFVGSTSRKHHDVEPLLTPVFTTNVSLAWTPAEGTILELTGRHVSTSHLDNTGNDDFVAPSYGVADASAIVSLARWIHLGTPQLRVQVNNLLDNDRVWPNGYSYLFFQQHAGGRSTLQGIPYYYPLAGRSIFAGLEIHL